MTTAYDIPDNPADPEADASGDRWQAALLLDKLQERPAAVLTVVRKQ